MTVLPVLQYPNPLLKETSKRATVSSAVRTLLDDMAETMYATGGVGLSAVQVGVLLRVVVIDLDGDNLIELINPEIIYRSPDLVSESKEGCLSVNRGVGWAPVQRAPFVDVDAVDRGGNPFRIGGEGFLSVCLQHEIDHLDGILFIDRLSEEARKRVLSPWPKGTT